MIKKLGLNETGLDKIIRGGYKVSFLDMAASVIVSVENLNFLSYILFNLITC
ncbi:MAG: hypothetical protein WBJ81_03455 [Rickettsiales bacterium]